MFFFFKKAQLSSYKWTLIAPISMEKQKKVTRMVKICYEKCSHGDTLRTQIIEN